MSDNILWTDERIDEQIEDFSMDENARNLARHMRNDYEARIAELEAQLAQTWQPLPDGEVTSFAYVDNGGKVLGVYAGDDYTDWYATEDLPDDVRLCGRKPQE